MPDPNAPAAPAAPAPGAPAAPAGSPSDPGQGKRDAVTMESVQAAIQESLKAANEKLWGDIKSMLGRTAAPAAPAATPPGTPASPVQSGQTPPGGGGGKQDAIDQRLKEMETRMEAMRAAAIDLAIKDALQEAGVSGDTLTLAQASFKQLHNGSISVNDEAGRDVVVGDTNLRDYLKTWLSGQGKAFVPAKKTPQIPGLPEHVADAAAAAGGVIEVTKKQAARLDTKLLKSGRVVIVD